MAVPPMGSAPSNTYLEPAAIGVREDLADIIYRIDPDETPLVSACARVGAKQVLTEWLVQELNPTQDNAQPEGFTAVMQAVLKPVRLNNICQILARTVGVSNTLRVVDVAGGEDEYNRQLVLRGMEVKRDLEFAVTSPLVRTITDPRHMSGLPCYCVNGTLGAGGTMPIGDGSNAGTLGTAYDLTLNTVQTAMQQCWQAGGKPNLGIMSGSIKLYFATLSQGGTNNAIVAQNIVQASPTAEMTIQGAVDVFRTDFGVLQLAPDRFCPAHQMLLVSTDYIELAPLPERDMVQQDYAQTGDNSQGGVVFEGCVRPTAPKSHAYIGSLNQQPVMGTLYERWDAVTERYTEVTTDRETGLPLILKTQNTTPIVESAKALASNFDPHVRRDVTHVARIPVLVWQRLMMTGVARDPKAFAAWLDSREAQLFRTDDRRKL